MGASLRPECELAWRTRLTSAALLSICLAALVLFRSYATAQSAGTPTIDEWRNAATETRILADNDAPRAYEEAQRLQAALPTDANPADRVRVLNLLSRCELYLALTEQAAEHARLARELALAHGDRIGEAEADLNVALNAVHQGRIDEAVAAADRSLRVLEDVDRPDLLGEALLRTTLSYRRMDQFDESVTQAMQAMEIAERSRNPLALTYAHQGLGLSYQQSLRFVEASEHFQKMRDHARTARSKLLEADSLSYLSATTTELGDLVEGERLAREAIAIYRSVGAPFSTLVGLTALRHSLNKQGRRAQSLPVFDEILATLERYPNRIGQWHVLNARSSTYLALGRVPEAMADAERAYTLARSIDFPLYVRESARQVAKTAAASGDYRRAYDLSVVADEMTARAASERSSARMIELARRYESESKQRHINELMRRNEQQAHELQRRSLQQRWLWTLLGATVIVLSVTAYFLMQVRHSRHDLTLVNDQLQRSQSELQQLNTTLEQRVQERTAQLAAANRELEAYNYSVSHDLRSPLRSIDGFSRILLDEHADKLDESAVSRLRGICDATRRMGQIIDDLLMLAHIGRAPIECTTVNLSEQVETIAQGLRQSAPDRAVQFAIEPGLTARADARLIRIALENLLGNAWKFTSRTVAARIEFGRTMLSANAAYFVRDNGAGFDSRDAARIFEAFERSHASTEFPGSGIGLATVQRIIQRHGSRVWAESAPGQGATFYFTL